MKYTIVIHAGAGPDSDFIREHSNDIHTGIKEALQCGADILEKGGSALDAVTESVSCLEDNPLFNSGKGSTLNFLEEICMDASVMNGVDRKSGGAAMLHRVKNPVRLAKAIHDNTDHVLIGSDGAEELGKKLGIEFRDHEYFLTDYQLEEFQKKKEEDPEGKELFKQKVHSTVGAVALDRNGNVAAATSTGGTAYNIPGRIADSCLPGIGCYADNKTCAISGTGDGEYLIKNVLAHSIVSCFEYKGLDLQECCDYIIKEKNQETKADMGVIALDNKGNTGICFNSERMIRGWLREDENPETHIY